MSKTLTESQIKELAQRYGIEYASLRAVIEIEASGSGFVSGVPKILFEPHIFHRLLTQRNFITLRNRIMKEAPSLCYPRWGTYRYGKVSEQHAKLDRAAKYHREAALESCSWGLGQVMGFHWKSLGYSSLQEFVNAMYESEAKQVEAMLRFMQKNNLIPHLKTKNWAKFARGYNGAGYAKNKYDVKLAQAHRKFEALGIPNDPIV